MNNPVARRGLNCMYRACTTVYRVGKIASPSLHFPSRLSVTRTGTVHFAAFSSTKMPQFPKTEGELVESVCRSTARGESNEFVDLGIDVRLVPGLEAFRFAEPTEIQRTAIPAILSGRNVAVQSYTGSGKTLAYLLPVLSMAIKRSESEWAGVTRKTVSLAGKVQAVVVAPSRELAMQIVRVAKSLLPPSAHRAVQQCIGGANMGRQREALKQYKPILVVGTPGRLAELSRDGSLQTHSCGILVLDEVDQLLAPQFREEMVRVTEHTGKKVALGRQTILVSATLSPQVLLLCQSWCPDPAHIVASTSSSSPSHISNTQFVANSSLISPSQAALHSPLPSDGLASSPRPAWGWGLPKSTTYMPELESGIGSAGGYGNRDAAPAIAPGLTHLKIICAPQHRVDTLRRAIHALGAQKALVFMNFQHRLKDSQGKLQARSMQVGILHGDMSKQERQTTMEAFRSGKYRALLVSDIVARGLDVPDCDAVFNLELPSDAAHYAHRAGRTGRAGRSGTVVTIASAKEDFVVQRFSDRLNIQIREIELREGTVLQVDKGAPRDSIDDAVDDQLRDNEQA
jgi:superfamily II DNA/RNA helicase